MALLLGIWRSLLSSTPAAVVVSTPANFLDTLVTLDLSFRGQPFVSGSPSGTDLQVMDLSFRGQPFVIYKKAS